MKPDRAFKQSISHSIAAAGAESALGSARRRAFVVEAVVLTFFLAASLAVVVSVLGGAMSAGREAQELSVAVTLAGGGASNGAEDFAANPGQAEAASTTYYAFEGGTVSPLDGPADGAYAVERTVASQREEEGTLYQADVAVFRDGRQIYSVSTASYVSGREG